MTNTLRSLYGQFYHGIDKIEVFFDGPDFTEVGPEFFQPEKDLYGEDLVFHVLPENLGYWGHGIRNKYQGSFSSDYIHHGDDDDNYCEGVLPQIKHDLVVEFGKVLLYRFRNSDGIRWSHRSIEHGNIGTPSGLIPNRPEIFGEWGNFHGGDSQFYSQLREKVGDGNIVWKDLIIYRIRPHVYGW